MNSFIQADKLARVAICRGLLSLYAVTLIIMVALSLYYHAQEFKYVAEDEGFAFKEEHLGLSLLEFRVAQEMRKFRTVGCDAGFIGDADKVD